MDANQQHVAELPWETVEVQKLFNFYDLPLPRITLHNLKPQVVDQYPSVKRVSVVFESSLQARPRITCSSDAVSFFQRFWGNANANDQERFVVACLDTKNRVQSVVVVTMGTLDTKNRVQSVVVVTMGTLDASLVHPREVFKPAILEGSSSVLLSHNHPSGDTSPSREDIQVTERLTEAGKLLGIDVLDHIIYGDGTREAISIRECT